MAFLVIPLWGFSVYSLAITSQFDWVFLLSLGLFVELVLQERSSPVIPYLDILNFSTHFEGAQESTDGIRIDSC